MRSFTTALIAAALATFAIAAPVNLPGLLSEGTISLDQVDPLGIDVTKTVEGEVHDLYGRGDSPSIAVIFTALSTQISPFAEELAFIDPSSATVTQITEAVAEIKAPILVAIPQLQALVGQEESIILVAVDGKVELTVTEVAAIVASPIELILGSAGDVLSVVEDHAPDTVDDVKKVLCDLDTTIASLVDVVVTLVGGVDTPIVEELAPVYDVVTELHLTGLATALGIHL